MIFAVMTDKNSNNNQTEIYDSVLLTNTLEQDFTLPRSRASPTVEI